MTNGPGAAIVCVNPAEALAAKPASPPYNAMIVWLPCSASKRRRWPSDPSAMDWWLADANGGEAVRTGMHEALVRAGMQGQDSAGNWTTTIHPGVLPDPGCRSSADRITFSADSGGEASNL